MHCKNILNCLKKRSIYLSLLIFLSINLIANNESLNFEKNQVFVKANDLFYPELLELSKSNTIKENKLLWSDLTFIEIKQLSKINDPELKKVFKLTFDNKHNIETVIKQLEATQKFEYVEKVPIYQLFHTPNDLDVRQWHLKKVEAEKAWDITKGNCPVVIAVIDDAIDTLHQDLRPVIWKNTVEVPGNGIDDDGNGYVDDFFGWDAASNNNDPTPPANVANRFFDHGTHCAGIAGAQANNGFGIASVGYDIQLMAVKVGYDMGGGRAGLRNLYEGIEYAIVNKANVVTMSLGGPGSSTTINNLINYGESIGITFVAAAGNNNTQTQMYPAAYPAVISVAASDSFDRKASFSTYGSWIDITAPGVDIYSTLPYSPGFGYKSGTSMACPLVASTIALMICKNPNIKPSEIKNCLKSRADDISAQNPSFTGLLGTGRMNAFKSVACVKNINAAFSSNKQFICPGQSVQFLQEALPFPQTVSWRFVGGIPFASSSFNPTVQYPTAGKYPVQIIVGDGTSFDTLYMNDYITVKTPTAIISGNRSVVQGSYTNIRVDLEGKAPFEIEYTDGTNNYKVSEIYQNPYYIISRIDKNTTFSLLNMSDQNCSGNVSGSSQIDIQIGSNCAPGSSFTKVMGSNTADIATGMVVLDSAVYLVGKTSSNTNGGEDGILSKYDLLGNLLWSKTYGGTGNDEFFVIVEGHNKQLLIGGATRSYGTVTSGRPNGLYMLLDTSGSVLRSGVYVTTGDNIIQDAAKTSDGGYILGCRNMFSSTNSQSIVIKVDSILAHQWGRQLTVGEWSMVFGICEVPGVGYYTANSYRHTSSPRHFDAVITKLSYNGTVQWSRYFGGPHNEALYTIKAGLNNEIWGYGHYRPTATGSDVLFVRLDTNGNILSSSRIHSPLEEVSSNWGFNIDSIGRVLTTSYVVKPGGKNDVKIVELTPNGEIVWQTGIGTSETDNTGGAFIYGDNFFYSGNTSNSRFGSNDILLSKVNCAGVSICLESDVVYTRDTIPLTSYNLSGVSVANVNNTQVVASVGVKNVNFSNESLCPDCESNQSNTFNQVLVDSFSHKPKAIYVSKSGNYSLTASTGKVNLSNHSEVFVNKISQSGSKVWSLRLRANNFDGNSRIAITESNDGKIYLATNYSASSAQTGTMYLACISSSGTLQWSRDIAYSNNDDIPASLITDINSNCYFAAGYQQTGSAGNLLISKFDSSGNTLWQRTLNAGGKANAQKIISFSNDEFYILSQTNIGTGSNNPMVTKINSSGQILWNKLITYAGSSVFSDLTLSSDSTKLAIVGNNTSSSFGGSDILVATFDTSLSSIWSYYYGAAGQGFALSVISHPNGYIISGNTTSYDANTGKQILLNVELNGAKSWTKIYGTPRTPTAYPIGTHPLNIGQEGNLFVLYKDSTLGVEKTGISRLDNCGNSFCHFTQIILSQKAFNPTSVTNQSFSLLSNPAVSPLSVNVSSHEYQDSFLCSFIPSPPTENDTCVWESGFLVEADCYNIPVVFRDTTLIGAGEIFSRKWYLGDGNVVIAGKDFIHKYDLPGVYMVKLELIGLNSSNRICMGTDSLEVVVPNELYIEYADTVYICASDSALFENTRISCWDLPIRAKWSPSIGLSDTSLFEPKASPFSDQWYYVTVKDRSGIEVKDSVFVKLDYSCCKSHASFSHPKEIYCLKDSIQFTNTSNALANATYAWDFGPNSIIKTYNGANPPKLVFTKTGSHFVYLSLSDNCGVDTFVMEVFVMDNPVMGFATDTILCFPDTIQLGGPEVSRNGYSWTPVVGSDNSVSNPTIIADKDTVFVVTMIDDLTQCSVSDSINIKGFQLNEVLGNDTIICENTSIVLDVSASGSKYLWNNGDTTPQIIVQSTGLYKVVISENICSVEDSIFVRVEEFSELEFELPNDTVVCGFTNIDISPNRTLTNPMWSTNATSQSIQVNSSGKYILTERGNACMYSDSILMIFEDPIDFVFSLGPDFTYCKGTVTNVAPSKTLQNPVWSTGDSTQNTLVSSPGLYILKESGFACIHLDSINATEEDPQSLSFSLGKDTGFCDLSPFIITPNKTLSSPIWQNGAETQQTIDINGGLYWLEERGVACTYRDSIFIDRKELPVFSLGADTFICENNTILLSANIDISSLNKLWDNGDNTITRIISSPGLYNLKVDNGICSYEDSIEISLKKAPILELPSDTAFCKGDTIFLNAFHPEITHYLWQLTSTAPQYQITLPGTYTLFTRSICLDTTYQVIAEEEYCDCEIYVPSAFSPNSDNLNEIFITSFCELQQFKMEIFDRWGGKLFETNDIFEGWDGKRNGKLLPAGSYLYVITLQTPSYNNGIPYKKSGTINITY